MIQSGSTHQYRGPAFSIGRSDCHFGVIGPARRGTGLRTVNIAEQAMGKGGFIRRAGPGGDDPKVAINLRAVGIDDDASRLRRDAHRERRLAAGRRPGNKRDPGPNKIFGGVSPHVHCNAYSSRSAFCR